MAASIGSCENSIPTPHPVPVLKPASINCYLWFVAPSLVFKANNSVQLLLWIADRAKPFNPKLSLSQTL